MNKVAQVIWKELLATSPVFGTAEVAARAEMTLSNASRDLANLARDGMVTRIRRGLWAVQGHPDFSPYAVVPRLFEEQEGGYVSLLSALNLHGMIEQIPRSVHVVTRDRRPALRTPVGGYEFYKVQAGLFGGFGPYHTTGNFDIATPEKALFDTLYFAARKGRRFAFLPELELPRDFAAPKIEHWIARVGLPPLRAAVRKRWEALAESSGIRAQRQRERG